MIYFVADTHHSHKNLISGTSVWADKLNNCRQFETVEEHNKVLVDNINSVVGKEDTLYHLGDWSFGGIDNIWNFRKQLICNDIRLVLGNHDHFQKNNKVLPNCVRLESGEIVDKDSVKLCAPTTDVRARELFTSVDNYLEVTIEKQKFVLCHFPMQAWNYAEKGSFMIHGHCIDDETEILTENGFKKYNEISKEEIIYSYNKDSKVLEKTKIDELIINNYSGKYFLWEDRRMSMCITDKHVVVGLERITDKYTELVADKYVKYVGSKLKLIRSGFYVSEGINLSDDELRLYICLAADGSITKYNLGRLKVLKPRKVLYFENILNKLNIEYTKNIHKDNTICLNFKVPQNILIYNIKGLDENILKSTRHQCEIILEAYKNTDGCINGNSVVIFSSKKREVDLLQHLFVINGYMSKIFGRDGHGFSSKTSYQLTITDKQLQRFDPVNVKELTAENKLFWCIKTKNENFLCRRNGFVYLTGNCHGGLNDDYLHNTFKIMDVGIDNPEFKPYSIEEIVEKMSTRTDLKRHNNL